jgi:hypothetical protein
LKAWNLALTILIILTTSGCALSKQVIKGNDDKVTDTYLSAISQGRSDSASFIRENLKINKAFGYVKPYAPVIRQADVRLVWVPVHKSKDDPETLVSGHWVYIMVKEAGWFIDSETSDKVHIPLIISYKESNKK